MQSLRLGTEPIVDASPTDPSLTDDNDARMQDELEALEAILGTESFLRLEPRSASLSLGGGVTLVVDLPRGYPSLAPPKVSVLCFEEARVVSGDTSNKNADTDGCEEVAELAPSAFSASFAAAATAATTAVWASLLDTAVAAYWAGGCECVFEVYEWAREQHETQHATQHTSCAELSPLPTQRPQPLMEAPPPPRPPPPMSSPVDDAAPVSSGQETTKVAEDHEATAGAADVLEAAADLHGLAAVRVDHMRDRKVYERCLLRFAGHSGAAVRCLHTFRSVGSVGRSSGSGNSSNNSGSSDRQGCLESGSRSNGARKKKNGGNGGGSGVDSCGVLLLVRGSNSEVLSFLKQLRTEKVDVDSKGRACFERQSSLLWHLQGRASSLSASAAAAAAAAAPSVASVAAVATESALVPVTAKTRGSATALQAVSISATFISATSDVCLRPLAAPESGSFRSDEATRGGSSVEESGSKSAAGKAIGGAGRGLDNCAEAAWRRLLLELGAGEADNSALWQVPPFDLR